jgi:multiple sugar transport system permease protein
MTFKKHKIVRKTIVYILLILLCSFVLIPFFWMISSSFKPRAEIFTYPPVWIPRQPTFDAFLNLIREKPRIDLIPYFIGESINPKNDAVSILYEKLSCCVRLSS